MAEKKSENKIMAMLERSGMIRKAGSEDGTDSGALLRNDAEIRPLIDPPDDVVKVTPAARQPIPGMPTPVFPSDKAPDAKYEQPNADNIAEPVRAAIEDFQVSEQQSYTESDSYYEQYEPEPYVEPEPVPAAPPRRAPPFGGLNIFRNGGDADSQPAAPPVTVDRDQPENYTDRFLNTEELYDALALRSKKQDTIYLIEEYLQTLPESLPDAQRREIVGKLLAASGFDYDLLMGDGVLRVKMLKEYAERFARHTDDYIAARQAEIDEMDQQILRLRRLIENRKDLHKKQFFSIEAEAQRLKEILTFISG